MKRKVVKYVVLCIFSIIFLSLSFMIGRYSWWINKPSFLLSSKEQFWAHKAKECMLENGVAEEQLKNPLLQDAIIVRFKGASDYVPIAEIVLDKISGEPLQWTKY